MQGLNNYGDNGVHGYVFMTSCGVILGAFFEGLIHERVVFASSVIMGIFFYMIHYINRTLKNENTVTKALLSAIAITGFELCFGIVMNRILRLHLWDFSDSLFHLLGQICPRESLFRVAVAFPALYLSSFTDKIPIKTNSRG